MSIYVLFDIDIHDEAVSAFMGDPDYQALKALREATSTLPNLLLIEGIEA